ncbi:MAG TPA: hypothetical protein VHS05_02055 [Pyrinomonadaceae bacterium]|jgi:hypothetical protein|nr:hypothetical protein [Pyrinomonadaceae bacterium]
MRRSEFKENGYILLRPFLALIALGAFLAAMVLPDRIQAARVQQQDTKQQNTKQPDKKQQDAKDAKQENKAVKEPKLDSKEKFTAEQIVESVIFLYGTRPGLEQIRRNGVERGKITRYPAEGNPDEANYERRFVRGENLDKDKIRLDQKLPTMEYSLIFDDGKLWGLINGAAFTPRQDATDSFISQHHHSLDTLLRYKECGATLTLVGKEQQKGLDLYVVDVTDKEQRKTRFYISARTLRVLWLEYEEGPPGGLAVKYTRKFLDYRIVQQTLAPYRIVLLENGRESQVTNVLTITYGVRVSDSIFKNPEG